MKLIEKGPWSLDQSTRYRVFKYDKRVGINTDGSKSYYYLKIFDGSTSVADIEEWSGRIWVHGRLQEFTDYFGKAIPIDTLLITDNQIQIYCEDIDETYLFDLNEPYEMETVKSNKSEDTFERFKKYDIIKHFKYETITDEMQKDNIYIYQVLMTSVLNTETDEKLIVYKALYNGKPYGMDTEFGQVFARPESMFYEKVDQEKYPHVNQKQRFELVRHTNYEVNEEEVKELKI